MGLVGMPCLFKLSENLIIRFARAVRSTLTLEDHSLSAIAAALGQILEWILRSENISLQAATSPPKTD